jgi:Ulp1 family protease
MKSIKVWEFEKLIFPICTNTHWLTVIMRMKTKEIEILDSLKKGTRSKSLDKLPIEVQPLVALLLAEEKFWSESKF